MDFPLRPARSSSPRSGYALCDGCIFPRPPLLPRAPALSEDRRHIHPMISMRDGVGARTCHRTPLAREHGVCRFVFQGEIGAMLGSAFLQSPSDRPHVLFFSRTKKQASAKGHCRREHQPAPSRTPARLVDIFTQALPESNPAPLPTGPRKRTHEPNRPHGQLPAVRLRGEKKLNSLAFCKDSKGLRPWDNRPIPYNPQRRADLQKELPAAARISRARVTHERRFPDRAFGRNATAASLRSAVSCK